MTKTLQGVCIHCGMPIEFRADAIGTTAKCSYCRKETELRLAPPVVESGVPKRAIVWTTVAVVILLLGLIGTFAALKRAEAWAAKHKRPAAPATK